MQLIRFGKAALKNKRKKIRGELFIRQDLLFPFSQHRSTKILKILNVTGFVLQGSVYDKHW